MASHQPQNSPNKLAFVLGNGRSRLSVNVNELAPKGIVFACNAIYREASVDNLIAVDVKMVNEIVSSGYNQTNTVWTNPNKGIINSSNLNFFDPHKGWSSGPTALWLAATMGHREIYILGFDFEGVEGKFNNVYADTFNYKKSWEIPTFYGNWVTQTERVIKDFPSTTFYRLVGNKKYFTPPALADQRNLIHMNYDTLATNFGLNLQKS
jgi:hypothetical protein